MNESDNDNSVDYFGLKDSTDDENDDDILNSAERKRKADSELDGNLEINAYTLHPSAYEPSKPEPTVVVQRTSASNNKRQRVARNSLQSRFSRNVTPQRNLVPSELNDYTPIGNSSEPYEHVTHPEIQPYLNKTFKAKIPKRLFKKLAGHSRCVNQLQWCIPMYSHLLLSASMDGSVKIWDVFQGSCVRTMKNHSSAVKTAQWNLDGTSVASGGYDKKARLYDVVTGKETSVYSHASYVRSIKWHPSENKFLTGSNEKIELWDLKQPNGPCQTYSYNFGQVQDILFTLDGNEFFCSTDMVTRDSADRTIMAWDFRTGAILSNQIFQERYTCPRLILHPCGRSFVAQTEGDYLAEFSTTRPYKMNKNKRYEGHKVNGNAIGCDFSHDAVYLLTGCETGDVFFYMYSNTKIASRLRLFSKDPCIDVKCHPVLHSTIAACSWNGALQIWH